MDILLSSVYNFIYLTVVIVGSITSTCVFIWNIKEHDKVHKAIFIFAITIYVYMIIDFITYYFLQGYDSGRHVFYMIILSDTAFCLLTTAWVYVLVILTKIDDKIKVKHICIFSAVYLVLALGLSLYVGRYDSYALHLQEGMGKLILQCVDLAYVLGIVAIAVICIKLLIKRYPKGRYRNAYLVMPILLICYMIWIVYWDYSTWFKSDANILEIYAVDPLILMYAIFSLAMIVFFYRKDPLKLRESQIASEKAIDILSEQYGISAREKEVLGLINCGMSNPQIADKLCISENTVKRHVNNILRKTETKNRHEIIFKISNVK